LQSGRSCDRLRGGGRYVALYVIKML